MRYRLPFALAAVQGAGPMTRLLVVALDCCFAAGIFQL